MANTVNILSYTNTFSDLLSQQNLSALELNTLGANNYTKNSGTLFLQGVGVGLSVTNTAIMGATIVSGTSTLAGDATSSANVFVNGSGYAFQVANNAIIGGSLITNNITSNTLVRTVTLNTTGSAYVNNLTANNTIRAQTLNATGTVYCDAVVANTALRAPSISTPGDGYFNSLTSNTTLTAASLSISSISASSISASSISGAASLYAGSTAVTGDINANTTTIATTQFVKSALNSSNTFGLTASAVTNGVYTNQFYSNPSWITSFAGSKITGDIPGSSAGITGFTFNQSVGVANDVQFKSLGIGTGPSGTTGEIRATNNITAYYSDDRLKTRLGNIKNALAKVMSLNGFQYEANETAQALGYAVKPEIGLSAQEVQAVLPEVVVPAPIDEKYLTIHYERVIPLLVEAIKELKLEIDSLKK